MKINIKKKLKSAGSTIKEMGSINKKSLKNGSYSMAVTAIVIAVLVVVNLIVGQIPEKYTQVDVSTQKLYTISDETVSYLKNLDTDITIYISYSPEMKTPYWKKMTDEIQRGVQTYHRREKRSGVISELYFSVYER